MKAIPVIGDMDSRKALKEGRLPAEPPMPTT
jgi:hypothetical protein